MKTPHHKNDSARPGTSFLLVPWLQFGHVTFSGGICASAMSAGMDVSKAAVCCAMWRPRCSRRSNPHSHTHKSAHLAPCAHIKPREHTLRAVMDSPETHTL